MPDKATKQQYIQTARDSGIPQNANAFAKLHVVNTLELMEQK